MSFFLYDDLLLLSSLFHFFYFIFSAFQFLPFFFCLMVFLKPLSSVVEKLLYAYV